MIPAGLCQCGCGQATRLARSTRRELGWTTGQPIPFVHGHHARLKRRSYTVDAQTGCWNWDGSMNSNGYPSRLTEGRQRFMVHRWYFVQAGGAIPDGFELDHKCKNTRCVNPAHMEPVTPQENKRRRASTKLSPEQIAEIRELAKTTPYPQISKRFRIARSTVSQIVTGVRWREAS